MRSQQVELPNFLTFAQRLGITTLTRPDYGLSLSLGAGEVPLIEMTPAFAAIANGGVRRPPRHHSQDDRRHGQRTLRDRGWPVPVQAPAAGTGEQVISPVDAFLMTDILSDNEARSAAFGPNSLLRLDRPAAVKTGTTNDIRDILTIGFTPAAGDGRVGGQCRQFAHAQRLGRQRRRANLEPVHDGGARQRAGAATFQPPPGVRQYEVCADTGTLPSPRLPRAAHPVVCRGSPTPAPRA